MRGCVAKVISGCQLWKGEERQAEGESLASEPVRIPYPMRDHLTATRPDSPCPPLAMILREARDSDATKVLQMVAGLCREARARDRRTPNSAPPSFWDWPDDYFDQLAAPPPTNQGAGSACTV